MPGSLGSFLEADAESCIEYDGYVSTDHWDVLLSIVLTHSGIVDVRRVQYVTSSPSELAD